MNLSFVESPLQAINAIEYLNANHIKSTQCTFVVFSNPSVSSSNLQQIKYVLNLFNYSNCVTLDLDGGLKDLIKSRNKVIALKKSLSKHAVKTCILGEYRSLAARAIISQLKPLTTVVVDDGNATLRINRVCPVTTLADKAKRLLAKLFGFSIAPPSNITFFSVYDINEKLAYDDSLLKNSYYFLKNKMAKYSDSQKIFIIGSPLEAAGVVEQDLNLTLTLIKQAIVDNLTSKAQLVYISHRRESTTKKAAISNFGVKVLSLPYPFELYALINQVNTVKICGFYSSLFTNLLTLNNNIKITSYQITPQIIKPEYLDFVNNVYENYKNLSDPRLVIIPLVSND